MLGNALMAFGILFLTLGNFVAYQNTGALTSWTLGNKDSGLVILLLSYIIGVRLVNTRARLYRVVEVFVVSGFVINVCAVIGGVLRYTFGIANDMVRVGSSLRLCGLMINPSSYGGWLLCVMSLQAALLIEGSTGIVRMPRTLQWINLVLAVVGIVMTTSRSSYIGCLPAMLAIMYFGRPRKMVAVLLVGACALGLVGMIVSNSNQARISNDLDSLVNNQTTINERFESNQRALDMLAESPVNIVTGIGIGTFLVRFESRSRVPLIIHNTFLWILVELGAGGLLVLLCILGAAVRNCLRVARWRGPERGIAVGVCCALVGTMFWFLGTEGLWHRHVWFLFILSEAALRVCSRPPTRAFNTVGSSLVRSRTVAGGEAEVVVNYI
jgi:hypothetical protein